MTEQPDPQPDQPEATGKAIEPAYAAAMPAPQGGALPTQLEWQQLERMAETLANSDLIPYKLKRKPGDVAVILLAAREYGIPPIMALSKLPVVNGTPAPMGELMVALILRAGHYIGADFRNPDGSVYAGGPLTPQHYGEARYKRRDWPEREVLRFTIDEAIAAGLVRLTADGKPHARDDRDRPTPWESYTPNMARWRAVANAGRLAFADVLMGLSYLPEELGAYVDAEGRPIDPPAQEPRHVDTGTVEERTAQEAADKLAAGNPEAGGADWPPEVLDRLRQIAGDNGWLEAPCLYDGQHRMTFAEALDQYAADHHTAETPQAPEAPKGPRNPLEDAPAPSPEGDQPPAPATGPQIAETPDGAETPAEAAREFATQALDSDSVEFLASLYQGADDLLSEDVGGAVLIADLEVLGVDVNALEGQPIPLGRLLQTVGTYVKRHGTAVRAAVEPEPSPTPQG